MTEWNQADPLPPFLVTSVPKSGTHLMHQILTGMPGIRHEIANSEAKFFIDHHTTNMELFKDHMYRLGQIKPNQFGLGHVFYSETYAGMIDRLRLKHIFVYRDPRDVLVSLAYFIPSKWNEHPLFDLFRNEITDTKGRMLVLLEGVGERWHDYDAWNRPFYHWIRDRNTLPVSFEELMSSEKSRKEALLSVVRYLWDGLKPPAPHSRMVELMEANIAPTESRTFRSGRIGSWRDEFDEEVTRKFKEIAGGLLIDFGYEKNNDWT
ncbi:sulfotransferase domain-containing protein [Cohnella thailandensis]|uniref:Sulfotransferase domain-containing protein n=1 Tax=Cohnella thailandensis TaxID=557557 RepID=A0A841SZJ3_9BACL|nr:sulfotransferase domain-containing protein [Cohnella thailandensis]MBB6635665.1 sulfotransferase domain-containing protein [Cohnella thailandensis]MBP1976042.1 hypothetical protein [Cohnella thailandensis]